MDEYSDDDLDGLNVNALEELENNAIQFTQARTNALSQAPAVSHPASEFNDGGFDFEDDDLDDTEVVNGLFGVGAGPTSTAAPFVAAHPNKQPVARQHHPLPPQTRQPNTIPNTSQAHRNAAPIPQRDPYGYTQRAPPSQAHAIHRPGPSQFARPLVPHTRPGPSLGQASQLPTDGRNDVVAALQKRIHALEADLNSARGESAIIRSNSTKAQQDHAAEVARLRKQNAEQEARNQRLLEAAVMKEKHATTELEFLQRDIQETTVRTKRNDPTQPSKGPVTGQSTPKRGNKTWAMADGFEDLDMIPSPSKSKGKSRDAGGIAGPLGERTPTRNKRKRPIMDSPVLALETHEAESEFLPLVLDHGLTYGEPPTFDVLSRYAFPSDPGTSFAAYIYQRLPLMGKPHNPVQLLVDFTRLVLIMWKQCLGEEYLRPIWDLATLVAFVLQLDTQSVAPHVMEKLVHVVEQSVYKVADRRYKSANGDLSSDPAGDALQQQIDTTYLLSIVHLVAMASVTSTERTESGVQTRQAEFWSMVPLDLVLILLTSNQRFDDIMIMLDLLCTSALSGSLGPLVADPGEGARMVLDKVSANLIDLPKAASTPRQKHTIALAVLRALSAFARTTFGALQIASHVHVIPRLVTTLSCLMDELYDMADPLASLDRAALGTNLEGPERDMNEEDEEDWVGLHRLVKQIVSLLHGLVTDADTAKAVNIQSKLTLSFGGPQRYILALSRIHFAEEDLVYEAGIDESTADMARELCEYVVTPDEGEGVREAFGI